jgi:hypothetical protein
MTYAAFDPTHPDGASSGPTVVSEANINDTALRDANLMGGLFKSFEFSTSGGTAAQPAIFYWKNGTTWLKGTPTWGSGAGQDGNVTAIEWKLSTDSGSNYDTIATTSLTFDSSGNLTAATGAAGWVVWLMGLMGKAYKVAADVSTHVALTGASAHSLGTISTQSAAAVAITGGTAELTYEREVKVALGNVSGSTAVNWAAGGLFTLTVTGSGGTLTWSNLPSGKVGYITLEVTNGGVATSLFTAQKQGGTALSFTAAGKDIVTLMCHDGATVEVVGFAKDIK